MNTIMRRLLDLESLDLSVPGVEFGLERPLAAWAWMLVAVAAVALGWRTYRRLEAPRGARVGLTAVRGLLLLLLVLLICGPRLVKPNEIEERDWVVMLVDRSASMAIRDADGAPGGRASTAAGRITREAQLRGALSDADTLWRELARERTLVWMGFDSAAYDLAPAGEGASAVPVPRLDEPRGRRTALGVALEQALSRAAGRPLAGIVVLSDGRSADGLPRSVARALEAEKIPVFTVPLGSTAGVRDVAVRRVDPPRSAFVRDAVPVEVEVERIGGGGDAPTFVELIDQATGLVLDTREVDWGASLPQPDAEQPAGQADGQVAVVSRSVRLISTPQTPGTVDWAVRVRTGDGAGDGADGSADLISENNQLAFALELVERPVRVLYLDGYPRWEYRYIKNLLVRERSLTAAVMLLAPGRRYLQEGTITIDALPRSPEEWAKFDVVMLGDLWPGAFTGEQLTQIRERVALAGAGLIWIGGQSSTPGAWRATPLGDLLPFVVDDGSGERTGSGLAAWSEPVTMTATPLADRLGVLRLNEQAGPDQPAGTVSAWPARLSDPETGWSQLRWAQRIEPSALKPSAEVLAMGTPVSAHPDRSGDRPLLLSMRYGAGRVLYAATDETWRWRYGRGEFFPERFWIQLVRWLGRESVSRTGKSGELLATPSRAAVEQPVRLELRILDQTLVDQRQASVRVRVRRIGDANSTALTPADEQLVHELTLVREGSDNWGRTAEGSARSAGGVLAGVLYAGTWIALESGRYTVEVNDPMVLSLGNGAASIPAIEVEVWRADDELRNPLTDHQQLAELSSISGGEVVKPADLGDLGKLLPNRRVRTTVEPEVETLWDTPLALMLVVVLLTTEWVWRRMVRLA